MATIDRDKMQQELLNRTKQSYDRREGVGQNHFGPDNDFPFWKASPTKDKPHIIDIIPFIAGPNFPTKVNGTPVKEGNIVYVLDVTVHKGVGPGKATVLCPAKNYGLRCPVCEEVDSLIREGYEYEDIDIRPKRQCTYNVIVMDSKETEEKGIQVWDVPYSYSEREIVARARSARDNAYIPFASTDRQFGRSIVFDVGGDKFKKITGHRFEMRDYDYPIEIIQETYRLDTFLQILSYEELCQVLWGADEKPEDAKPAVTMKDKEAGNEKSGEAPRSFRGGASTSASPATQRSTTGNARVLPEQEKTEEECPYGGIFGEEHDKYGECEECEKFQLCAEALDRKNYQEAANQVPPPEPMRRTPTPKGNQAAAPTSAAPTSAAPTSGRRFLGRPKTV